MRRFIISSIIAVLSLLAPGIASAHQHPGLQRGEARIRANAMLDHPSRIILTACHRDRRIVRCHVEEINATTYLIDDGVPLVGNLYYEGEARSG